MLTMQDGTKVDRQWFLDRIGKTVLRDGKPVVINNEKEAGYYHSLQSDMEFKDVERKAPNVCLACEG